MTRHLTIIARKSNTHTYIRQRKNVEDVFWDHSNFGSFLCTPRSTASGHTQCLPSVISRPFPLFFLPSPNECDTFAHFVR